ncbi:MAG: hypothetical protein ACE37F_30305 [Nannocystaceae bacterium]|nr:hypothetical protein [bacterium]
MRLRHAVGGIALLGIAAALVWPSEPRARRATEVSDAFAVSTLVGKATMEGAVVVPPTPKPSPRQRRLEAEVGLEQQGMDAREALIERQRLRLERLAKTAERGKQHARAQMLRRRLADLDRLSESGEPEDG